MSRIRVALIADPVEEGFLAMRLLPGVLITNLEASHSDRIEPSLIRPPFVRRFSRPGALRDQRASFNADRLLNRFWDYPRHVRRIREQFDVFHLLDHSYSQLVLELPGERTIVTCHDLDTFRCLLEPAVEPRHFLFRSMCRRQLEGLRRAAQIACDSHSTCAELFHHKLAQEERVTIVPLGVESVFSPEPNAEADAQVEQLLGKAASPTVDILHVGNTTARKRIDVLLRVFAAVKRAIPAARLVKVGGLKPAQQALVRELGLDQATVVLPFLDKAVLAAVYRGAALFLLPSKREGFGLPLLEALACGTPVLASDIPALREIGGDAAAYCPVGEEPAWIESALRLLSERECTAPDWCRRRSRGLVRAAEFSWTEHTNRMVDLYQQLCS